MRIKKQWKRGFTLIEALISVVLIAVVSMGFMVVVTGSSRVLGRAWKLDNDSYQTARFIEERTGTKQQQHSLKFSAQGQGLDGKDLTGDFVLYEYEVFADPEDAESKSASMHYFDNE